VQAAIAKHIAPFRQGMADYALLIRRTSSQFCSPVGAQRNSGSRRQRVGPGFRFASSRLRLLKRLAGRERIFDRAPPRT